jgi:hypothetical protein
MQVRTSNATGTAKIRDASVIVIKVVNYYYTSDNNTYNYTTGTYQDGLSLNIPAEASGEYLVMSASSITSASTAKGFIATWCGAPRLKQR